MRRNHAIAVLFFAALLGGSCSSGKSETIAAQGPTTTTTTAAPTVTNIDRPAGTTTSTAPATADTALTAKAVAATLQPDDFPAGFKPAPAADGGGLNLEMVWADLTRCLGVASAMPPAGIGVSPTFLQGLATQARSTVEYTTAARATAVADALAGPRFDGCANPAFGADVNRSKPDGATAGPAAVAAAPREVAGAQRTLSWRINASVFLADLEVKLYQDFVVVVNGGTVARFLFLNPGSEFPPTLERTLIDKVLSRA